MTVKLIDCTFRDGGYYNNWDFRRELIVEYLSAMDAVNIDYVELGFRSLNLAGFRGACAFTTDQFINSLPIPVGLKIGVMVNASELVGHHGGVLEAISELFTVAENSPVTLVRIACHFHEFEATLPACSLLKSLGYEVGINLMQVADRSPGEIEHIGRIASAYPLDVLYFADSLGSLEPNATALIVESFKAGWQGQLGIHAHDNMGMAVANTMRAVSEGVSWIDCTVTGMGRGPGNAQTEYMLLELAAHNSRHVNMTSLLSLINNHFKPMQVIYGWGKNPYYYLAGQNGIHPTYVQEMLADPRYREEEILSVIDYLKAVGGKKYAGMLMEEGRQMFGGNPEGGWHPQEMMHGNEVLIIGSGPSISNHLEELERLIVRRNLVVIALNTQVSVRPELIKIRAASHPIRLLADHCKYKNIAQPIVVPLNRLPNEVRVAIKGVTTLDYGLITKPLTFEFNETFAVTPSSMVIAYALAMATGGKALRILLAGFDGYGRSDPRSDEMNDLLQLYQAADGALPLLSVTPTIYDIPSSSLYAL